MQADYQPPFRFILLLAGMRTFNSGFLENGFCASFLANRFFPALCEAFRVREKIPSVLPGRRRSERAGPGSTQTYNKWGVCVCVRGRDVRSDLAL